MHRDMNLVRQILLGIEEYPEPMWVELDIPGYTPEQVSYHVMLLADAGLVEAVSFSSFDGFEWKPKHLTWEGHEFLEASRDDNRWKKALNLMKEKGGGITFDVLKDLLLQLMRASVLSG